MREFEGEGFAMKKTEWKKEVFGWVKTIVLTAAAYFAITSTLIANAEVPTGSMENTIMSGSRIIINRLAYLTEEPQRGEVISFWYPDNPEENYLKRIIALPGETVEGKDGIIYINGKELEESYIREVSYVDFGPYTVPEESYFVMGDNRNNSWDSRYWNNKFVSKDAIIGKAEFEYYPEWKWLGRDTDY